MRKTERELTNNPVVLKILEELAVQRKTEREMEAALGLANGTFTRWKYMNGKTYMNHISRIAEYLNVTQDYLLTGKTEQIGKDTLSPAEIRLVMMYRKLDATRKKTLLDTAEYFMYSKKYNDNEMEAAKTGGGSSEEDENPLS